MSATFSPPPRIAFRTDASIQIGTGHVMRCLTLADALTEQGAECTFISRAHEGNLNGLIAARGHQVLALPAAGDPVDDRPNATPAHGHWLGTGWVQDADQTLRALGGILMDWLVVDHYALDARWEKALRSSTKRLMVIDDLADRLHDCDLLVDQGLGRTQADYCKLVPSCSIILTGPGYALLRPEFAALRQQSLDRRRSGRLEHLLVTLGGVDKDNVTGRVLEAIRECRRFLPANLGIKVIMGPHAPWLDAVKALTERMPWPTDVAVGVTDMGRRMAAADLAIGAAGSTAWERCCLGLPSIQMVLAANQQRIAVALAEAGAALSAESETIADVMRELLSDQNLAGRLTDLARAAGAVTDGNGTWRVTETLMEGVD